LPHFSSFLTSPSSLSSGSIKHLDSEQALADLNLSRSTPADDGCNCFGNASSVFKMAAVIEDEEEEEENEGENEEDSGEEEEEEARHKKAETGAVVKTEAAVAAVVEAEAEEGKLSATESSAGEVVIEAEKVVEIEDAKLPAAATPPSATFTACTTATVTRKLAVYWHSKCEQHEVADHPEQPNRVRFILRALQKEFPSESTPVSYRLATPCTDEHLKAFHTPALIEKFKNCAAKVEAPGFKKKSDVSAVVLSSILVASDLPRSAATSFHFSFTTFAYDNVAYDYYEMMERGGKVIAKRSQSDERAVTK
jgi:hypothetical protein